MSRPTEYQDWKYIRRVDFDNGGVARYTISFYRRSGDEIRYDSHERKKGRNIHAPHFHMKLRSRFKDDANRAVEEIKEIIDNYVRALGEVLER